MTKTAQYVTAILFCIYIAGFGILHILTPDREFSPVENRNLHQLPEFSWTALADGSYTDGLETYLSDQFPMRDSWTGLKTRYEYLLGKREFHNVYLCGDTLISKVSDSSRADQNLSFIRLLAEKTEIPVYFGLIPTAAEVWRDKLPEGACSFDQKAYLEKAKEQGAQWVDIAGALSKHAEEPIFYRTDHHWTSLGAYYGYTALMEALGKTPAPLGKPVCVSDNFLGTLYSSSGVHWIRPDSIERYVDGEGITVENVYEKELHGLYVDDFLNEKDKYASFLGGNAPLYIVRNENAASSKKLLVVRDSYSDSSTPFLSQEFSEIHLLDLRYNRTSVARYAEENGMDLIFVCYSVENFIKDIDAVFLSQ